MDRGTLGSRALKDVVAERRNKSKMWNTNTILNPIKWQESETFEKETNEQNLKKEKRSISRIVIWEKCREFVSAVILFFRGEKHRLYEEKSAV